MILITTTVPNPTNSDDLSDILEQANWEEHFGSKQVYQQSLKLVLVTRFVNMKYSE